MRFLSDIEPTWKEPSQERSRERVAAVLSAARELIAEGGLASLKMGLLAERAGVPIGTIYQFFPDKDAVIGCIFANQMEEALRDVHQACNPEGELQAPAVAATSVLMAKYNEWRADPVMAKIWSIAQANRALRGLTRVATRATAEEFALMTKLGMSHADALRAETIAAADLLGLAGTAGVIEPGAVADIVAVAGDPLQYITCLQQVELVIQHGRVAFDGRPVAS
jgi:AcrR family transcriptional regulator